MLDTRREGLVLKARCRGSRPSPYRIEVSLDETGIESAWCSCPVQSTGCKHVVAVLVTWIHESEPFSAQETLEARVRQCSKQELIGLIEQMIERHPDLERLIGLVEAQDEGFDEQWVRNQIQQWAHEAYGPEASNFTAGTDLYLIENLGHKYIEDGRWTAAARLFCAVADELLALFDAYPYLLDHAGGLLETVMAAVDEIDRCLSHLTDPDERRTCFRTLFSVYRWDTEFGGLGISDRVPDILTRQGSEKERVLAAGWTRGVLAG